MRLLYFIKPHVMEDYLMSKYASVLELIGNTPVVPPVASLPGS